MKIIAKNKKASFEHHILEKYEAGLVLLGSELKSIRAGKVNISDAFVDSIKGELFLLSSHIAEYDKAKNFGHNPTRPRKLLLHKRQANKLLGAIKTKGQTIVPTILYFSTKNYVKVEIALTVGKKLHDKREAIKQRDWDRQKQALLKNNNRS